MASSTRRALRIFLASPGDLEAERRLSREVVENFNRRFARHLGHTLELLGWEDTLPGVGRPQALINKDVDECDLSSGCFGNDGVARVVNSDQASRRSSREQANGTQTQVIRNCGFTSRRFPLSLRMTLVSSSSRSWPFEPGWKRIVSFSTRLSRTNRNGRSYLATHYLNTPSG